MERPTIKDLSSFVIKKYASDWKDIGKQLGLESYVLDNIATDNPMKCEACLEKTLDSWLKLNTVNATWKTLEVAITNVNRTKFGLDPVNDVYGEDM